MKIMHITDIHGDTEALAQAIDFANETKPDILACTGDYLGFLLTEEQVRKMRESYSVMRNAIHPQFPISGKLIEQVLADHGAPEKLKEVIKSYQGIERTFNERAEGQYGEMERIIKRFGGNFISVPGDVDTMKYIDNNFFRGTHAHMRSVDVNGFKISGVGFSGESPIFIPPTRVVQVSEREFYEGLMGADPNSDVDVVLTHIPPYSLLDETGTNEKRIHAGSLGHLTYLRTNSPSLVLCGHLRDNFGVTKDRCGTVVVNSGNLGNYSGYLGGGTFTEVELDGGKYVTRVVGYQIKNGKVTKIEEQEIDS